MATPPCNRRQLLLTTAAATFSLASLRTTRAQSPPTTPPAKPSKILLFSGTGWYRHPEIPQCNGWLVRTLGAAGYDVDVTETPADLTPDRLQGYDLFLINHCNELTTLLSEPQRKAIEEWYRQGKGIVALPAALVHQTGWTWFYDLAGCDFNSDATFQKARLLVDPAAKQHPAVQGEADAFWYEADWTNHDKAVTGLPGVQVLLRVDETTYTPVRPYFVERGGKGMGKDHPIAWLREFGGGRFFYTELGHDLRSMNTPFGKRHILEGVRWAAKGM